MTFFIKESDVERLLETERRDLPDPDGGTVSVRMFRLGWQHYDELTRWCEIATPEWLVKTARAASARAGADFEQMFATVTVYLWKAYFGLLRPEEDG